MYKIDDGTKETEESKNEDDEWVLSENIEEKMLNVEILEMKKTESNSLFQPNLKNDEEKVNFDDFKILKLLNDGVQAKIYLV